MYPQIMLFDSITIYLFGVMLTVSFIVFIWMLKKLSGRFGINFSFFTNRILWLFLSTFFFSRLFYIISRWNESKFIESPLEFFITSEYNLSIMGAVFGFLLVVFLSTKKHKIKTGKYIDAIVLSFLLAAIFGYIGAFLGGQIAGQATNTGLEITFNHSFSPFSAPLFPLGLLYSLLIFTSFSVLYIIAQFIKIRGIVGYIGIASFATISLVLEPMRYYQDYFAQTLGASLNQILAILLILFSFYGIIRIATTRQKDKEITL